MPTTVAVQNNALATDCFADEQARADAFAASFFVTLPTGYTQWITSFATPGAGDQDKIWLRIDAQGYPIEALLWAPGLARWVRWFSLNKYAPTSGGAANAYTSTYSPTLGANDITTGQVFAFKATFANTSAATWSPDGLGPYAIKKNATVALAANDIVADQMVVLYYDGTNMQMVSQTGNSQVSVANITPGTEGQILATVSGVTAWRNQTLSSTVYNAATIAASQSFAHGLSATPGNLQLRWKCNTPDIGYVAGDEVPAELTYLLAASGQKFSTYADATNIYILTAAAVTATMTNASTQAHNAAPTLSSWDLYVRYSR